MNRGVPIKNKILSKKWEESIQRIHMLKLRNMQPRVNSGRPTEFFHLKIKAKREQMLEDRFTEIERENRILLEKMSSIMNKRHNKDQGNEVKSLNTNARKLETRRIALENQAMLKRLQKKTPCYNSHQWEEDRRMTEKRLKNICEFPYIGSRGKSTPVHFTKPRKISSLNKSTMYKKGISIDDKHFVVEITKGKNFLLIYLNDAESPDSYTLKIPLDEALQLMGGSYNYERLVNMLEMEDGEIVLVDPRDVRGYETAPVQDGKFKTSGPGEFRNKPRTKEEKMIHSLDFGGNVRGNTERLEGKNNAQDLSKTGYDGFHINTKRNSEDLENERKLKECCLKIDKKNGFGKGRSESQSEEEYEDEYDRENEEESQEYEDKSEDRNVVEEEDEEEGREDNQGDANEEYSDDEEAGDKYSLANESADKSVTLLNGPELLQEHED